MAIGWFSVLSKVIPWGDVINAAPQIVKGAKRLFRSTMNEAADVADDSMLSSTAEPTNFAGLNARVGKLQTKLVEMETEQQASAALIQSLAEQNAQVIGAVEVLRRRTRMLMWVCAAMSVAIIALVLWRTLRAG